MPQTVALYTNKNSVVKKRKSDAEFIENLRNEIRHTFNYFWLHLLLMQTLWNIILVISIICATTLGSKIFFLI